MSVTDEIKSTEKQIGVFLTSHHIVLYLALAATLLAGTYLVMSKVAEAKEARAQAAETALAVEKDHSAQLAAAFAQAQAQRDKDNAASLAAIAQIKSQTQVQIVHDKALPAPDLGHRIETLTGFKQDTIVLDSSQNLVLPLPLGQEIAAKLDQGEADAATVAKQESVIKNDEATIKDQAAIIVEDKAVLAKQIDADAKVLSAEKAACRKSKMKWFGAGVVVGFIGRRLAGF
jgi:hypothetical protein